MKALIIFAKKYLAYGLLIIALIAVFIGAVTKITSCTEQSKISKLEKKTKAINLKAYGDSINNYRDLQEASRLDSQARFYEKRIQSRKVVKQQAQKEYVSVPDTSCCDKAAKADIYIPILEADNADKDSAIAAISESKAKTEAVAQRLFVDLGECKSISQQWQTLATKQPNYYQRNKGIIWGTVSAIATAITTYYVLR